MMWPAGAGEVLRLKLRLIAHRSKQAQHDKTCMDKTCTHIYMHNLATPFEAFAVKR